MMFEDDTNFDSYDKAESKARAAFELYENGKLPQALIELEQAIDMNPTNSSLHFNKALALDALNRFEDAIREYETALELNPIDPETMNSLAVDYTRTGQYDRGIAIFEQIEKLDPAFEPCYCNRIITYTEMEQHDMAEQMFYLAQQIEPDCALCYYNIGNSLFIRGQYKKAVNCWLKTAELEPTHPQINYRIAQACWSDGDFKRASEYFLIELRANPGDTEVILDFGLLLLEAGNIESAKEKFNRILELKPETAAALFYLGEIAFNEHNYAQANELFREALHCGSGELTGPQYRLAQMAMMQNNKKTAKSLLLSELELSPENPEILISMALMFLELNESIYATHCLLRASDLDTTNADAYYYLGIISMTANRYDDALKSFERALAHNPHHLKALKNSAIVYFALGKFSFAADRITRAQAVTGADFKLIILSCLLRLMQITEKIKKIL